MYDRYIPGSEGLESLTRDVRQSMNTARDLIHQSLGAASDRYKTVFLARPWLN